MKKIYYHEDDFGKLTFFFSKGSEDFEYIKVSDELYEEFKKVKKIYDKVESKIYKIFNEDG